MFREVPLLDRVAKAAAVGFTGAEVFLLNGVDAHSLRPRLDDTDINLVHLYANPGDFDAGDRGIARFEGRVQEFQNSIKEAIEHAELLGCALISCLVGRVSDPASEADERLILLKNLEWAADVCGAAGISVLIEPISNQGQEYGLRFTSEARDLIDSVGSPHLKLLYDIYHAQTLEGNIAETIAANLSVLGHIQVADRPGRHEPGSGELNYEFLFQWIDYLGYDGWIGCEYEPMSSTVGGLSWAAGFLET